MNTTKRCVFGICAMLILALMINTASAQRVRFGPPTDDPAAVSGGISVAARTDRGSGWTAAGSNSSSTSLAGSPAPVDIYSSGSAAPAPSYTYVAAPPPASSPAASYGATVAPVAGSPQWVATGWDPYLVASRSAAFSGTIQSAAAGPQFIVPQPQPRVPNYTQQPVAATGAGQPYVVIPEANCAAPPIMQAAPVAAPALTNTTVVPQAAPVAAPFVVPPTIPTLPAAAPIGALPLMAPHCYAYGDAIFFTRNNATGNRPLVLLDNNAATQSNVLLSTPDLDFNWQVGPRILLGREWDGFRMFEASYFGIYNWQADGTVTGNNNLNLPGDLGLVGGQAFFDADRADVTYKSLINNAELNYLHSYGNIAWLVGFRYFNLQDKLFITFNDDQSGVGTYNISAYNNLFGGQIGGRIWQTCGNWSYDLTGKAGVYGNVIKSSQNVFDVDATLRDNHTSGNQVAFIGDIEFNANYQFTPTWSLRGGYQVFWIEGLALAPNQLDFTNTATSGTNLDKTGGMFMHGAHAGLMAKW